MSTPTLLTPIMAASNSAVNSARNAAILSDGTLVHLETQFNPPRLRYSTDHGLTWSEYTGAAWSSWHGSFSTGNHDLVVDADDNIYVPYNIDAGGHRCQVISWNGSAFSAPANATIQGGFTTNNVSVSAVTLPDPDGTDTFVVFFIQQFISSNVGQYTMRFNGSTLAGVTSGNLFTDAAWSRMQAAVHTADPGGFVAASPSTPVISVASTGESTCNHRTMTWNGTGWTLGTHRTTTITAMFDANAYWDGTNFIIVGLAGGAGAAHFWSRAGDASSGSLSSGHPSEDGITPSAHFSSMSPDGEILLGLFEVGRAAGARINTWAAGSWGGWSDVLSGTSETPNWKAGQSPGRTVNNRTALAFTNEVGTTDEQKFMYITWDAVEIAPVVNVKHTGDDGYSSADLPTFDSANQYFVGNASGWTASSFVRFRDVPIPQGATILSAFLNFSSGGVAGTAASVVSKISFEDADSATAITSQADHASRVRTTANVAWSPAAWVSGTRYTSPDIKTVIQEVVDRGGWASGNDMQLLWDNNGTPSGNRLTVNNYEASYTYAALLIVYEIGGAVQAFIGWGSIPI